MENSRLREFLSEFDTITKQMCKNIETEEYDSLQTLLEKRETIIQQLDGLTYLSEEFKALALEFRMQEHEDELNAIMNKRRAELKSNIDNFMGFKSANKLYNSAFSVDSIYLNKKY